ncbi:MAG: ribosomal protein S12 methylthiotransferase RimO [Chloroflexi bacterium RBG_19FT_COMBO_56_12]|nr:MAG: ribosomal protein S12 methylthiotransferase RimO [Chloroflexi bacterium RBG_19FT_COMBO_56_12]
MKDKTFHMISLGCAKNTVDSASMAQLLAETGYRSTDNQKQARVLIVNTCGFIGPAKDESLRVLGELAEQKRPGQFLIAAGCLTQRYGMEVARQVPGIDGILGTRRWMDIVDVVEELRQGKHPEPLYHLPEVATVGSDEHGVLRAAIQGASAYVKIADGCRRPCAFCAIPLIKGTSVSHPVEAVLAEARQLQAMGMRELILIAQDTTDYGHDLGIKDGLAKLLEQMVVAVPEVDWIRVMYAYPGYVTDRLIEVMASHPQILPYLDMPLQHAHPATLQRMRRPANIDWVHSTLKKMRTALPELALRTTFIVGYPGETNEEFQALLDFVQEIRFDRVGTFQFSFEPGTASEPLGDPVPSEVKEERYDRLMTLQQGISLERNQSFVGQTLDVLIEGRSEGIVLGRSYRDAPEIDGLVIVEGEAEIGELLPVRINGAMAYDLTGVFVPKN